MVKLRCLLTSLVFVACCLPWIANQSAISAESQEEPTNSSASKISDSDRAIIGRSTHSVWFDAKNGTVRPIRGGKSLNVDDRHNAIAGNVTKSPPSGWWITFKALVKFLFESWQILLLIFLIALLATAASVILKYGLSFQSYTGKMTDLAKLEREKAKLQDLPFEVEQTMFGLLGEAERYRAAGDYSKAIVYLFSHALVEMDGARCIRLARGKTNRAYLRELRDQESLRGFTNQLVSAFEYAFFGKHVLSQEAFERIWQQVPAFDMNIKQIGMNANKDNRSVSWGST